MLVVADLTVDALQVRTSVSGYGDACRIHMQQSQIQEGLHAWLVVS